MSNLGVITGDDMMQAAISTDIASKTMSYWKLSMKWNGRSTSRVTCADALDVTQTLIRTTDPKQALSKAAVRIQDDIIRNKRTKKARKQPKNVIPMAAFKVQKYYKQEQAVIAAT